MTAIQQFIEDAIAGGYDNPIKLYGAEEWRQLVLLDRSAWQAVGKTRGWLVGTPIGQMFEFPVFYDEWRFNMHRFIDHLADGKTIEEALSEQTVN